MFKKQWVSVIFFLLVFQMVAQAQFEKTGSVTYITSQHVYVRFDNTLGISPGDTLYTSENGKVIPVCVVKSLSSVSCSCTPVKGYQATVGMKFSVKSKNGNAISNKNPEKAEIPAEKPLEVNNTEKVILNDTTGLTAARNKTGQVVKGRVSITSYSVITGAEGLNAQRMKYNFSLSVKNIADSKFSAETQLSFSHRNGQWNDIQDNIFNGLKIYSLAAVYEPGNNLTIKIGRKINPKVANLGAVDGIQAEYKFGSFTTGILAGSRPDYTDYSFNAELFQYGAFLNYSPVRSKSRQNTSIAFVQQNNAGKVDRRFTYLQHNQQISRDFGFFGSAEFDLYRINSQENSLSPEFTNLYLSLRYRYKSLGSASLAYSSRKNIIYYETYKNFLDQLLDQETSQGFLLNINLMPLKRFTVGLQGGYRNRTNDIKPSENINIYLNYSEIPFVKVSVSAGGLYIVTPYLQGASAYAGLSKLFLKGKLNTSLSYKFSNYNFSGTDFTQMQHSGELSAQYRFARKISLSIFYEALYDYRFLNHRVFAQISKAI